MSDKQPDPIEVLRRSLGIDDDSKKVVVGGIAVDGATFEERQREHQEQMRMLAEAGADHRGQEVIRRYLRRSRR